MRAQRTSCSQKLRFATASSCARQKKRFALLLAPECHNLERCRPGRVGSSLTAPCPRPTHTPQQCLTRPLLPSTARAPTTSKETVARESARCATRSLAVAAGAAAARPPPGVRRCGRRLGPWRTPGCYRRGGPKKKRHCVWRPGK